MVNILLFLYIYNLFNDIFIKIIAAVIGLEESN